MEISETLARMWIECDPNRGGSDPDEPLSFESPPGSEKTSTMDGQPTWRWFLPRAEATLAFLDKHNLQIVPKG